jgi:lantibiotic modifying enzyme
VPLGGMAHGASGFATAFARLYEATGEARYADAALKALDYERVLFSPRHQNWRDCRDIATRFGGGEHYTTTWAHGAPGVGLARVALLHAGIRNDVLLEELAIAVRTTLALQSCPSHAVISGSFGNIELLLASQPFVVPELAAQICPAIIRLLQEVDVNDWNLREKAYRPLGLMTGVTGIGYQCLRIAYPEQVPSLLSCMTPRASSTGAESGQKCINSQESGA